MSDCEEDASMGVGRILETVRNRNDDTIGIFIDEGPTLTVHVACLGGGVDKKASGANTNAGGRLY